MHACSSIQLLADDLSQDQLKIVYGTVADITVPHGGKHTSAVNITIIIILIN